MKKKRATVRRQNKEPAYTGGPRVGALPGNVVERKRGNGNKWYITQAAAAGVQCWRVTQL